METNIFFSGENDDDDEYTNSAFQHRRGATIMDAFDFSGDEETHPHGSRSSSERSSEAGDVLPPIIPNAKTLMKKVKTRRDSDLDSEKPGEDDYNKILGEQKFIRRKSILNPKVFIYYPFKI